MQRGQPSKAESGKGARELARTLPCEPKPRAEPTSVAAARWPRAPGPKVAAAEFKRGVGLLRFFAPSLWLPLLLVLLLLPAAPPLLFPL